MSKEKGEEKFRERGERMEVVKKKKMIERDE